MRDFYALAEKHVEITSLNPFALEHQTIRKCIRTPVKDTIQWFPK